MNLNLIFDRRSCRRRYSTSSSTVKGGQARLLNGTVDGGNLGDAGGTVQNQRSCDNGIAQNRTQAIYKHVPDTYAMGSSTNPRHSSRT